MKTDEWQFASQSGQYQGGLCGMSGGFWGQLLGSTASLGCGGEIDVGHDEDGWYKWEYNRPPSGKLIQVWREGWDKPVVRYKSDFPPEFNICGVKWRLTGIAKQEDEPTQRKENPILKKKKPEDELCPSCHHPVYYHGKLCGCVEEMDSHGYRLCKCKAVVDED